MSWLAILRLRDERVLHYLTRQRRGPLDRGMRRLTHLGDASVTITVSAGLLLSPGAWHEAGRVAAFTLATSHLAVQLLKRTISRPRPCMPAGVRALIEAPDRFSFPSGHAAAALSVALGLATVLPGPVGAALLGVGLMVGVSRAYLGVHYPGDVLAGWLLAGAAFIASFQI